MIETMKAAVFTDIGKIEVKGIQKPIPKRDELLIRLKSCAICTWEQRVYQGVNRVEFPFIGGHEMSGVIEEMGEDVDTDMWKLGERVVVGLLNACGNCYYCRMGQHGICKGFNHSSVVGGLPIRGMGGFSEYLSVSPNNLFKIDGDISFETASLTEPLSCVIHSIERGDISIGDDVVVVGAGIMGMLHLMLAKRQAARVIVSEPDEERRKLALQLGADEVINPLQGNPVEKVKDLTGGRGAQVVFVTTAISQIAKQSIDMAGRLGKVVIYSSYHPDNPVDFSPNWIHKNMVSIVGTANSNITDFEKSIKLLSHKIIDPAPFISGVYPLAECEKALQEAVKPTNYRVIINL